MAFGKEWHEEHFVCADCGRMLAGRNFFEKNGAPYCQDDYNNKFAPKCYRCQKPIIDTAIMALGKTWHQDCFKCSVSYLQNHT